MKKEDIKEIIRTIEPKACEDARVFEAVKWLKYARDGVAQVERGGDYFLFRRRAGECGVQEVVFWKRELL